MTTNTYLIKEGYTNLNKHGSKTISTMLIICATMLILGIFVIIFQNVNYNVKTLRLEHMQVKPTKNLKAPFGRRK